jgi:hypothetical protein
MESHDKLLVTETDEIITVADYVHNFNEEKERGVTIGDAISNMEYSIKHGILKRLDNEVPARKIKRATAIYTGGGCYIFYAELADGNWMYGTDDCMVVVDTNPIADMETFEASTWYEWQLDHLVEEIPFEKIQSMLKRIIEVILRGDTDVTSGIDGIHNYSISDMKYIYHTMGEPYDLHT